MPVLSELCPDTSLLTPDFDGYKLSLDKIPTYHHEFSTSVENREPTSDQFSFLFVRAFGLHNHLHGDPWVKGHVYYFNQDGELLRNAWNSDRRSFDSKVVTTLSKMCAAEKGDLNATLNFDCANHAAVMNGKSNGHVTIYSTGDRSKNGTWQEVADVSVGNRGILRGLFVDTNKDEMQILVESIVHADTIPELNINEQEISSESATLVHWLTINPTLGKDCVTSQRKFCVHGAVEYLAFEDGGQAVYVASQKEVLYTFDSTRPCTPPIERALRETVNYTWNQTENEVVVTFNLNAVIDESCLKIDVDEELKHLLVSVQGPETTKKIIDGIMSQEVCKEVSSTVQQGITEIRLTKKVADQLWEEFIPNDHNGTRAPTVEDVTKAAVNLEKFTSDELDDEKFGSGFNPGQLEECDDEEVSSRLVRIPLSSHSPSHTVMLSGHQWIGGSRPTPPGPPAMLLRHDVDALVWQPSAPDNSVEETAPWKLSHLSTFPGFGYVQASKTSRKWVVAPAGFKWVAVVEGQQHIYIYHQPQPLQTQLANRKSGQKVRTVARQQVISLPDNAARVLGAYPEDSKLYILHKNSLLVLSMAQD